MNEPKKEKQTDSKERASRLTTKASIKGKKHPLVHDRFEPLREGKKQ
jgi:hypothetical protein